jgi:chorismate synthase
MRGSEYNDPFFMDKGKVRTKTNNCGGILGGITNGMPMVFRAAFKPTPSISKPQQSVNLVTGEDVTLNVKGRHDPCVVPRAVPCVIAAAAIVMLDIITGG